MSFSSQTREELTRIPFTKSCCMRSELAALVSTLGTLSVLGGRGMALTLEIESPALTRRAFLIIRSLLALSPGVETAATNRLGGKKLCRLTLAGDDAVRAMDILGMTQRDPDSGEPTLCRTSPKIAISRLCDRRAFLRAAFMGCGCVVDPAGGYQLEYVTSQELAVTIRRQLARAGYAAGMSKRRDKYAVYIKNGDGVVSLLAFMGASSAVMKLENARVSHMVKNRVNRMLNCDAGNLRKQMVSADAQIATISTAQKTNGLSGLSASLRELALIRLRNPADSLEQLGQQFAPPLTKNAVNHRMRRLMETLAGNANEKQEE